MIEFFLALAAFIVSHTVPTRPPVRAVLVGRLGEKGFRVLYSAVSLGVVAWLISAALRAPVIVLWWPEAWHAGVPLVLMPLSFILLVLASITPNPLSISLTSSPFDPERPGVTAVTRHPMLWGFALWALSHLIANGDLVSVILFGGLGVFSLAGMRGLDRKMKMRMGAEAWDRLAAPTSILPFAAVADGRTRLSADRRMFAGLAVGVTVYVWFLLHGHDWIIGVDPLSWFA